METRCFFDFAQDMLQPAGAGKVWRILCGGADRKMMLRHAAGFRTRRAGTPFHMTPYHLVRIFLFFIAFFAHHFFQTYAWKIRTGSLPDPDLWEVLSFPFFAFTPRRMQHFYFRELLFANSFLWGIAASWLAGSLPARLLGWKPRRRALVAAVPVRVGSDAAARRVTERPRRDTRPQSANPGALSFGGGRYEVIGVLGAGAFATVHRAYDHVRGLEVAIKALNIESLSAEQQSSFRESFQREASLAGRLDHHGIVAVLDHDAAAEEPYIVMSLVKGGTLRQRLDALSEGNRVHWAEAVEMGTQVAEALEYARQHGIRAHRDIKPANLFRGDSGYKVGDFGVASLQADQADFAGAGTPGYMAPEQLLAARTIDWRADLFSLCAVLYQSLTGRMAYEEGRPLGAASRALDLAVAPASTQLGPIRKLVPDVPAHVAAAIERGLQFDRNKRFASWQDFIATLRGER